MVAGGLYRVKATRLMNHYITLENHCHILAKTQAPSSLTYFFWIFFFKLRALYMLEHVRQALSTELYLHPRIPVLEWDRKILWVCACVCFYVWDVEARDSIGYFFHLYLIFSDQLFHKFHKTRWQVWSRDTPVSSFPAVGL